VVLDGEGLAGLITAHEIKNLNRARWPYTTVYDIMRPADEIRTVRPETPLKSALEIMSRENLNQLPVTTNGHFAGLLTRTQVLSYLHSHMEFQS
jgi:CBS domain-containing protein